METNVRVEVAAAAAAAAAGELEQRSSCHTQLGSSRFECESGVTAQLMCPSQELTVQRGTSKKGLLSKSWHSVIL